MSGSRRGSLKQKSERFDSNINKRGNVKLCAPAPPPPAPSPDLLPWLCVAL
jgi:hypothetical protein